MTITTCPKCGSMNITTAGVCENCGWSQFAQVALCTRITGEMELKVSGKALLDDYKRLLFENKSLESRIAELEGKIDQLTAHDATERQDDKWIPVSERLPDNWKPVLTIDMSESTRVPVPAFYDPETSLWSTHLPNYDLWVTHWMPLPEPPEVENV